MRRLTKILSAVCIGVIALAGSSAFAAAPEKVRIAGIFPAGAENAWVASVIQAVERLKANPPHGLEIEFDYTENVYGDKALTVYRNLCRCGL